MVRLGCHAAAAMAAFASHVQFDLMPSSLVLAAGTLLGGITFRNVLVRFDRASRRVGFGPGEHGCGGLDAGVWLADAQRLHEVHRCIPRWHHHNTAAWATCGAASRH